MDDIKKSYFQLLARIDSREFDWMELYKEDPTLVIANIPRWPIFCFLTCAFICLFFSSMFHLFYVKNKTTNKYLLRMDYAGISILIAGSTIPGYFYGFYCNQFFGYLYVSLTLCTCTSVFLLSFTDWFHYPQNIHIKSLIYGGLGGTSGLPMIHLVINELIEL